MVQFLGVGSELAVIPSGGGDVINKFQVPGFLGTLRWSPDGKALHYVLTSNGASNIWEQSLSSRRPKQLTHFNSGEIFDFSWTADHQHLLMTRGQSKRDVILLSHLHGECPLAVSNSRVIGPFKDFASLRVAQQASRLRLVPKCLVCTHALVSNCQEQVLQSSRLLRHNLLVRIAWGHHAWRRPATLRKEES